MSQMIRSYEAYLERWKLEHPNVVQPMHLQQKDALPFWKEKSFTTICKYWQDFGNVYEMSNGQVYEVVMQGPRSLIACFESMIDWLTYDHPATIRQHHDQW